MELGIYHEFPMLPGRSQAECFAAGFDIVDASEEYGLDVMWLAELHFDKRRALAASPLVLGTAIAARTERIRIGTSVQVPMPFVICSTSDALAFKVAVANQTSATCDGARGKDRGSTKGSKPIFWGFERLRRATGSLTTSPALSRIATIGFILAA